MWGGGWGYWGWGWWFWMFWIFVIFLILWAIPWRRGRTGQRGRTGLAPEEQIARERYARGEITREEFEQTLKDLRRAA